MSKIKRVQTNILLKPNFPTNDHSSLELRLHERLSTKGDEFNA